LLGVGSTPALLQLLQNIQEERHTLAEAYKGVKDNQNVVLIFGGFTSEACEFSAGKNETAHS
jgi:hypothetical protein